jgi:CRP/FNR family transcriptional regulator
MTVDTLALYPSLSSLQPSLQQLEQTAPLIQVPGGQLLFEENAPCQGFPLVLEGEIKVSRDSGDGRSIELYRVVPGEICLVSSACLFRQQALTGRGVTVKPTTLRMIDPLSFSRWLDNHQFRDSILGLFADRMADLTSLIDAVAFSRLDQRLAAALLGHGTEIATTHQRLADEIGTVREMVTRLLKRFETEGWVALSRERIRILNSAALRAHSSERARP